jgi:LuxR family maltose regulon positive regulatory protein
LSLIAGMRGRRAEQLRLADEAAGLARERGLLDSVEVGRCTRHAASRWPPLGHPEAALPELEQGVLLRRLWGQQLDVVDGLVALAPATAATGDRARAAELLDEAEAILAGCPDPGALPGRLAAARRTAGAGAARTGARFTDRELTVLRLLSGASSEREIGQELFVSFNTVHSHVKSIYRKLGASSRAEALARARAGQLL